MLLKPIASIIIGLSVVPLTGDLASGKSGQAWYVDCHEGAESGDGHSPSTAWTSLRSASAHTFQPGDSIYLRRGSVCSGILAPKGSGSAGAPIRLSAWGTGPLPRIEAAPGQEAALKLFDQEYWTIEDLEFSGGRPHAVFISGSKGVLHAIHIKDIVVHDVFGTPATKEDGLLVIASSTLEQHFDDVLIDGVTAYDATEWAGILIGGVAHGFEPEASRNTNVVIRNSIVHDVAGDGIVLFQTNTGRIENSVAWRTGMQDKEIIGTPNAIWTWMCRNCAVRHNEAFLTDSPGVDGGAFDIDYGNDDNIVEENYGHDTQGYCIAVFAAGWVTGNSMVRNNICVSNGLSPRLARRQGAVFLSTWNGGKIHGLEISGNQIFWNPPLAAAAILNIADFEGTSLFEQNTIRSDSPLIIQSNSSLLFDRNSYQYCGRGETEWQYGGKTSRSFREYQQLSGQDAQSREIQVDEGSTSHSPFPGIAHRDLQREADGNIAPCMQAQKWCLLAWVAAGEDEHDSRGQVAILESTHAQFPNIEAKIVVDGQSVPAKDDRTNLRYNWNTGDIPVSFDDEQKLHALPASRMPGLVLVNPLGKVVWRHEGFTTPGELGLLLRSVVGAPAYAEMPFNR